MFRLTGKIGTSVDIRSLAAGGAVKTDVRNLAKAWRPPFKSSG
jgi:hypothetical protein